MTYKMTPASEYWAALRRDEYMRGERDEVEESLKDFFGERYLEPDQTELGSKGG